MRARPSRRDWLFAARSSTHADRGLVGRAGAQNKSAEGREGDRIVLVPRAAAPSLPAAPDRELEIRHPRLRRLYAYWLDKCGDRSMPARRDLDPLDFPYVIGDVSLLDVLRGPLRFRFRLHGTNLALRIQRDMTGMMVEDVANPEYRAYVIARCHGLVESRQPLAVLYDRILGGRRAHYEALWLPLSSGGVEVDMLLLALIYEDERRRGARRDISS
jgi:hypothetical protein